MPTVNTGSAWLSFQVEALKAPRKPANSKTALRHTIVIRRTH